VLTHRPVLPFLLTGRWSKSNLAARVRLRVPYSDSRADCALLSNVESRACNFCPVFLNEMNSSLSCFCCLSTVPLFACTVAATGIATVWLGHSAVFSLLPGTLKHSQRRHAITYIGLYSDHAWATPYAAAANNEQLSAIIAVRNCSLNFGTLVVKRRTVDRAFLELLH
jgi:hypothetical protein